MLAWRRTVLLFRTHPPSAAPLLPFLRRVQLGHSALKIRNGVVPVVSSSSSSKERRGSQRLREMSLSAHTAAKKRRNGSGGRPTPPHHHFFAPAVRAARWADVVLTPATLLKRLEIIFPPAAEEGVADGSSIAVPASPPPSIPTSSLSSRSPLVEHDGLRPCCRPVPWDRVVLRRVGATTQPEATAGRKRKSGGRGDGGRAAVVVHITAAVYDVFIPSAFLFPSAAAAAAATLGDTRGGGCSRRQCRGATTTATANIVASGNNTSTPLAWLQHVGSLHHIPGLPDPKSASMSLRDYAAHLQQCSDVRGEQELHCMTSYGLNNRDIGVRSLRERFLEAKECPALEEHMNGNRRLASDGAVGVWIVHPWRESIFFALRYSTMADHYEWVCRPRQTLWQNTAAAAAAAAAGGAAAAATDVGGCTTPHGDASSLAWAREPLRRATAPVPSSQGIGGQPPITLSTVMYYCASGVPHTAAEKAVLVEQLLADDASGGSSETRMRLQPPPGASCEAPDRRGRRPRQRTAHSCGGGIMQLASVWAPLPRSSHLLRGRRLIESPEALAEALKYGLLRVLH